MSLHAPVNLTQLLVTGSFFIPISHQRHERDVTKEIKIENTVSPLLDKLLWEGLQVWGWHILVWHGRHPKTVCVCMCSAAITEGSHLLAHLWSGEAARITVSLGPNRIGKQDIRADVSAWDKESGLRLVQRNSGGYQPFHKCPRWAGAIPRQERPQCWHCLGGLAEWSRVLGYPLIYHKLLHRRPWQPPICMGSGDVPDVSKLFRNMGSRDPHDNPTW